MTPGPSPDGGTGCSRLARAAGEALAGTATQASVWAAVEHPGAWPARVEDDPSLPPHLATWWRAQSAVSGVRCVLVRAVGRHPAGAQAGRRFLLARTAPSTQLWTVDLAGDEPPPLVGPDVVGGDRPTDQRLVPTTGPVLLVCTNGRRDRCCAAEGRPAAQALADAGEAVWESSHLGGHRFAPTVLSLPDGWMFGGAAAAGRTLVAARGRTCLEPAAQAAEIAVLHRRGHTRPVALDVVPDGPGWLVDGVPTQVDWQRLPDRPESCGKAPVECLVPQVRLPLP